MTPTLARETLAKLATARDDEGRVMILEEAFAGVVRLPTCWRKDSWGHEGRQFMFGPLEAGHTYLDPETSRYKPGMWRGWSMALGSHGDGEQTGWFVTEAEARASVEKALREALGLPDQAVEDEAGGRDETLA